MPNVSEGRDLAVLDALSAASGRSLLDRHVDADHHRSVFTLAGPADVDALAAVRRLARAVAERLDLGEHTGVHPRIGALDVVPFVPLDASLTAATEAARSFAEWIVAELAVPVFFYDACARGNRSLPEVRRTAFTAAVPDLGPVDPHPRLGAVAVGAREPLVAVNCWLASDDLAVARSVAAAVRERDGGLPGVRALGLALPSRGVAQVSMNLVALHRTGVEEACTAVRERVEAAGARVGRVELVGLLPAAELARCSAQFLAWSGLGPDLTIEARLAAQGA
ncbi:MAG: glutamate formiminotransferase [Acidimicrobiia bacterium]